MSFRKKLFWDFYLLVLNEIFGFGGRLLRIVYHLYVEHTNSVNWRRISEDTPWPYIVCPLLQFYFSCSKENVSVFSLLEPFPYWHECLQSSALEIGNSSLVPDNLLITSFCFRRPTTPASQSVSPPHHISISHRDAPTLRIAYVLLFLQRRTERFRYSNHGDISRGWRYSDFLEVAANIHLSIVYYAEAAVKKTTKHIKSKDTTQIKN